MPATLDADWDYIPEGTMPARRSDQVLLLSSIAMAFHNRKTLIFP
jgi:hypothetical protein